MSKPIEKNTKRLDRMVRVQRDFARLYGSAKGLIGVSSDYFQVTDRFFAANFGTDMLGEPNGHGSIELQAMHDGVMVIALFNPANWPDVKARVPSL